jgi:hypothetical protein
MRARKLHRLFTPKQRGSKTFEQGNKRVLGEKPGRYYSAERQMVNGKW